MKIYNTRKCIITVIETGYEYEDKPIYCIKSERKSDKSYLIRFGTIDQVNSILNTYTNLKEKRFHL